MDKLIKKLGIDETLTKPIKKTKTFTHIKDNIPLKADYNFMADLLMLPETKKGFKYLLVVVDLATDEFDIEPIKTKEPEVVLNGMKAMYKRNHIKKPFSSIRTDSGSEFKGVFHKYLYDESILHKISEPSRHKQLANVESLNKQLGRLLNGYMNAKEEKTKKVFKEWDEAIDIIRNDLNQYRKKPEQDIFTYKYPSIKKGNPKFKIGEIVYHISEVPKNALNQNQNTSSFRMGDYRWDKTPRKIVKILYYSGDNPFRYLLDNMEHVSYAEYELMKAKGEETNKFIVKKILDKKSVNKKIYYLVWWKGYLKKDATWEPKDNLIKDVPELIEEYESNHNLDSNDK